MLGDRTLRRAVALLLESVPDRKMTLTTRCLAATTFPLDLPESTVVAADKSPKAVPIDDPAAAVAAVLTDPLDFPPLSRATVRGDRIVIALAPCVPQAASVVAGVVYTLLQQDVDACDITILQAAPEHESAGDDPTKLLDESVRGAIHCIIHQPHDKSALAYLASTKAGNPVYLNRVLTDADLVIPIGTVVADGPLGGGDLYNGLYPTFADAESIRRVRTIGTGDWLAQGSARRDEAAEVAWLLGVQFALQVVPGPGDSILHVLAGDLNSVASRGRRLCDLAWNYSLPRRARLVVATMDGGREQQTWDNFSRALLSASHAVDDDGVIVICSRLSHRPVVFKKPSAEDVEDFEDESDDSAERPPVPPCASLLADVSQRARVFLLSELSEDVVEEMGMAYVSRIEEVSRLSRQFESCILLANAHFTTLATIDRD